MVIFSCPKHWVVSFDFVINMIVETLKQFRRACN